jgi:hypothetical protein
MGAAGHDFPRFSAPMDLGCETGRSECLEHDRVSSCDAGLAQKLHIVEELFFGIGQNVAGVEYGIDFLQKFSRDFAGDPIAGVRAVVENFLQENPKSRSGGAKSFADCQPA